MKLFVLKWLRQQCRSLINKPRWQRCCKEFPWSCIPSRFCTAAPATKHPPLPLHWRSFRWSSPRTSSTFWNHRLRTESPASVWKYWKKINKRESLIFAYETLFEFLNELWVRSTKTCRFERIFRSTCHCLQAEGRSGLTSKRWELPAFNHKAICANWRFRCSKTKNYLLHNRHQQNPIIRFGVKRWRNLPFCFTLNPLEGSSSTTCMLGAATRTLASALERCLQIEYPLSVWNQNDLCAIQFVQVGFVNKPNRY